MKSLEAPYISFRTGIKAETDTDRQKATAELELALRVGADLLAPKNPRNLVSTRSYKFMYCVVKI